MCVTLACVQRFLFLVEKCRDGPHGRGVPPRSGERDRASGSNVARSTSAIIKVAGVAVLDPPYRCGALHLKIWCISVSCKKI